MAKQIVDLVEMGFKVSADYMIKDGCFSRIICLTSPDQQRVVLAKFQLQGTPGVPSGMAGKWTFATDPRTQSFCEVLCQLAASVKSSEEDV